VQIAGSISRKHRLRKFLQLLNALAAKESSSTKSLSCPSQLSPPGLLHVLTAIPGSTAFNPSTRAEYYAILFSVLEKPPNLTVKLDGQ